MVGADGIKWIVTADWVRKFKDNKWKGCTVENSGLSDDAVYNISISPDGRKGFATASKGVSVLLVEVVLDMGLLSFKGKSML